MELVVEGDVDLSNNLIKIRRTLDNIKKRPNGNKRHDPLGIIANIATNEDEMYRFVHHIDLEWLSLNYRKVRAAKLSPSKRRMILVMFESDFQYLPTIREIRDGLIEAQMEQLQCQSK